MRGPTMWICSYCGCGNDDDHFYCHQCQMQPDISPALPVSPVQGTVVSFEESNALLLERAVQVTGEAHECTVQHFVHAFVSQGWAAHAQDALQKMQSLLDNDVFHSVPYVKSARLSMTNTDTIVRVGRRYNAPGKVIPGRMEVTCEMCGTCCDMNSKLSVFECSTCTFINQVNPDSKTTSYVLDSLNVIHGKLFKRAPTEEEVAQVVRASIQTAIIHSSYATMSQPRLHDFMAIDRTMRAETGLLSNYAPLVFRLLRNMLGISEDFFCSSLLDHDLVLKQNNGGASGSFFLFSKDNRFVVKSISKKEVKKFRSVLPEWFSHFQVHPDSLLPRFLGMYKVAVGARDIHYFVVVTNVFDTLLSIDAVFDLKGSTSKRFVSDKLSTLKDLNWREPIWTSQYDDMVRQIEVDSELLQRNNIMDYSLLVGVHRNPIIGEEETYSSPIYRSVFQYAHGGLTCQGTRATYFISIIDVLQDYDATKQVERFVKTKVLGVVSSVMGPKITNGAIDEQVTCIYCKSVFNQSFHIPMEAKVVSITCPFCMQTFDLCPDFIAKSDINISSLEPALYRSRFTDFVRARVLKRTTQIAVEIPGSVFEGDYFNIPFQNKTYRVAAPQGACPGSICHIELCIG